MGRNGGHMAEDNPAKDPAGTATEPNQEPDYKALYEQALADAEKWKTMSRKNESKAKTNADAVDQLADLSKRLEAIEGENAALKASAQRAEMVHAVAADTGVPENIVAALSATDKDELTAAAKAIAEAYKTPGGAPFAPEAGKFPQQGANVKTNARQFAETIEAMLGH